MYVCVCVRAYVCVCVYIYIYIYDIFIYTNVCPCIHALFAPSLFVTVTTTSGTGAVTGVLFEDITVDNVYLAIELQSIYCPHGGCAPGNSAVQFANITFRNIRSKTRWKMKAQVSCSPLAPCKGITFDNVMLESSEMDDGFINCSYASIAFLEATTPSKCSDAAIVKP